MTKATQVEATGKNSRVSPEERTEMVRGYVEKRESIRQIAARMNRGYHTVWLALTDEKVAMRRRGGNKPAGRTPLEISVAVRATIVRLRGERWTLKAIANQVGLGTAKVTRVLDEEHASHARPPRPKQ